MIGMLTQAPASQPMAEYPDTLIYLKSAKAISPAPETAMRIARSWDKVILNPDVPPHDTSTKAATQPSNPYDCVVSEYSFNGIRITTKQTFSVWFAEITPVSKDADLSKTLFSLLKLKSTSGDGVFNQIKNGTAEDQKLTGQDSAVYEYSNKSDHTGNPTWRSELRVVRNGPSIHVWTLKLDEQPMAAVMGYDGRFNENWFARLGRSRVKSRRE